MYSAKQFKPVVEQYQSLVWAIAYGYTGNEAAAEDITQETFLVAWRRMEDVRDPDKLRPFLSGIARNLARNARRKQAHRRSALAEGGEPLAAPSPLDLSLLREDERLVSEAMVTLDPESREALLLYYMREQSSVQLAEQLGVSQAAARQRLTRARRALRAGVESLVEMRVGGQKVAVVAAVLAAIGAAAGSASAASGSAASGSAASGSAAAGKGLLIALGAAAALVLAAVGLDLILAEPVSAGAGAGAGAGPGAGPGAGATAGPEAEEAAGERAPRVESLAVPRLEGELGAERLWADQPLVTGRARSEYPEGDIDGDGTFSEDELAALRVTADDTLAETIANNLDKDVRVSCNAISLDQVTGVHEQTEFYPMEELREQIESWRAEGLELSDAEAIASIVATRGGPDRLCAPLGVLPDFPEGRYRFMYDTEPNNPPILGVTVVDDGTLPGDGALVAGIVEGSLAEKLDIEPGDVIAAVNGTEIHKAADLPDILERAAKDGSSLVVEIERAGVRRPIEAELE